MAEDDKRVSHASRRNHCSLETAIIVFLMLYIGAHFTLSRVSRYVLEKEGTGIGGFYYLPCTAVTMGESEALQIVNVALVYFFYPIWAVDFYLLGGPVHSRYPMVELGP